MKNSPFFVGLRVGLEWKQAHTSAISVNRKESTSFQFGGGSLQRRDNVNADGLRRDVLRANLNNAWFFPFRGCKDGAEVQVVSQDDKIKSCCVGHDFFIRSICAANL